MTADIAFGHDPVHKNAFSFVKLYIFRRFCLAFTLKRSNGGLGSKKKVLRKQRFIVLMRTGKKEDSQKCWLQSLWHLYRRNRRTLCMQASLPASSPGGAGVRGCGREKGKIWLVRFWQLNTRGAIGASGDGIQMHETPLQALPPLFPPPPPILRESLLAGCMQVQGCPKSQV